MTLEPPDPGPSLPPGWGPPPAAPAPGIIPLRPLSVVEILDGSFATLRTHPRATIVPALIISALVGALGWVAALVSLEATSTLAGSDGADLGAVSRALLPSLAAGAVTGGLQLVGVVLLTGIVTIVVSEAALGRTITVAAAWRRVRPLTGALVGLTALIVLILLPLLVLCLAPALWVGVGLSLAVAVRVIEPGGTQRSLRRSWDLVRGTWWRTFGSLLLASVIAAAITALIALPFSLPELAAPSVDPDTFEVDRLRFIVNTAIATVGRVVAGAITLPFTAAVISLIYLDRRMRRENLHVALARAASQPGAS